MLLLLPTGRSRLQGISAQIAPPQAVSDRQSGLAKIMHEEGATEAQWGSLPREPLALVFLSLPLKDRQALLPHGWQQ